MDIHVYIHDESASVNPILHKILTQLGAIMTKMDDLKAVADSLTSDVAALKVTSAQGITLLNGLVATIADLLAQLKAAGTDPVALQAAIDQMTAAHVEASADVKALQDAITADSNPPTA